MPKMTEILSRISSLSTQLHNPDGISDQDYDNHIRALLEYLREVMPNEASDIISGENSLLDVSGSFNMKTGQDIIYSAKNPYGNVLMC